MKMDPDDPEIEWKEVERENYQDAFVEIIAKFRSRKDWKASPPSRKERSLKQPIPHVVFSTIEVTGDDKSLTSAEIVKRVQERDMSLGMADIQCNFVVTEDGLVWEGRGWEIRPGSDEDYPGYQGKFIEVTNIGSFTIDKAKRATSHLIDIGVLYNYIDKNFSQLAPDKRRKGVSLTPKCPFEVPEAPSLIGNTLVSS